MTTVSPRISSQAGLVSFSAATYAAAGRMSASTNAHTFTAIRAKKARLITSDSKANTCTSRGYRGVG